MSGTEIIIKHRFTQNTLYACDAETLKGAVEKAVKEGAYLEDANLRGANLEDANLRGVYLRGANLRGANLRGANLRGAYLRGANLRGANLEDANLRGANLTGANLEGANLEGAYLEDANLRGANLTGAYLEDANLEGAYLEGEELYIAPICIANLSWPVLISAEFMRIGCQRHSHVDWATFSDDEIDDMSSEAKNFWSIWKEPLLMMCAKHRAEALKAKGESK